MNRNSKHNLKRRGITLLVVIIAITVLSAALGGVLTYSLNSFKNAHRLALVTEAHLVAASEMEYLYNRWAQEMTKSTSYSALPAKLQDVGLITAAGDSSTVLTPLASVGTKTNHTPNMTYRVQRNLAYTNGAISNSGISQIYEARVTVTYQHPVFGEIEGRAGRNFIMEQRPMFDHAIFKEGDMEFAPGGNMTIRGKIAVNGNLYAASQNRYTLTLAGFVAVTGKYNGSRDINVAGNVLRNPDSGPSNSKLKAAVFDSTPDNGMSPVDANEARRAQLIYINDAMNFLGGIDIPQALRRYPDAYPNENTVHRSIIAPPPLDATGTPIPEDPVIRANRMYTKASVIVKIDGINSISITTPTDPTVDYANNPAFKDVVTEVRTPVTDIREGVRVRMTTIDVGRLSTALRTAGLDRNFGGVVYIYDTEGSGDKAGIRLVNGRSTPNYNDAGFSIATDNGLYVQGDYNTAYIDSTAKINNRAVLMADAVTVLSDGWKPENATKPIKERKAKPATVSGDDAKNSSSAANTDSIVAAIITGGTPTKNGESGGGLQNLLRYSENWANIKFNLKGAIGQLFDSEHFTGKFRDPTSDAGVYVQPAQRNIEYDPLLATHPPGQAITITRFSRGEMLN